MSRKAYCAAAVAFLIAGFGTASAEVEDIGGSATAFSDDGVAKGPSLFRDRDGFGTLALRPWGGDFTSLSVAGKVVSSLGSDNTPSPDGQDGGRPLPTRIEYELSADYSSSVLDGSLFPATVTDFGSVDLLVLNDPMLFGDNDGFAVKESGYWSLGRWNFDVASEDRIRESRSAHCLSDGSSGGVIRCEADENLGSFITTSSGARPEGADQSGPQSPNFSGPSAPFGGAYLGTELILSLEMIAARNSFAIAWPSDVIQGPFSPTCGACDVTPPVVAGDFAPASDFVNPNGSPNFDPTADPLFSASFGDPSLKQGLSVPEIPPQSMLLTGFAGLALVGRRRLWGAVRLG